MFKKTLAFITALCFAPMAFGILGLSRVIPDSLEDSDLKLMMETARVKMEGKPVGTMLTWENPETKNKGEVTLMETFKVKAQECRSIRHNVALDKDVDNFVYMATICKDGDTWVNLP